MDFETLLLEKQQGVAIVTLNRPASKNALSAQLKRELDKAFEHLEEDDQTRAIVLTGGLEIFSAGADLKERSKVKLTQHQFYTAQRKSQGFYTRVEACAKPVIGAISGVAVGGGCELALACDLRIASETARFGLPEVKLGVMPAAGGTQRLPRLIGTAKAKEMLFTGDFIDAAEAYRLGLANRVTPVDRLMDEALALASNVVSKPPLSLKYIKQAVNRGMQMDIISALDYEAHCFSVLSVSEDRQEGIRAFIEKRKPEFKGR